MSEFAIVTMIVVSSLTAWAGWLLARATTRPVDAAPGAEHNSRIEVRHARPVIGAAERFLAIIEIDQLDHRRHLLGDAGIDALLARLAEVARTHLAGFVLDRIAASGLELTFMAADPAAAKASLQAAIEAIEAIAAGGDGGPATSTVPNNDQRINARAAYIQVGDSQVTQAMFDLAAHTLITRMVEEDKVLLARPAPQTIWLGRETETIRRLREAIRANTTQLFYQPKLDVRNSSFPAAEALFRWDGINTERTSIGDLIHSAERLGAIRELTLWTLRQAICDQLALIERGLDLTTYVNLSGELLSDTEFTLQATEIIKSAPGKIGLEITETAVIEHPDRALASLNLYAAAGAPIAIDDYGTGLSSLRYLKRIPADELKIDREFIAELTSSNRDPMIVRSTIDLAHALDLRVTAEGVDDPTKLALLKVMGCDFLQGFHIARPMPLTDLIAFMGDHEKQQSIANPELSLLPKRAEPERRRDQS